MSRIFIRLTPEQRDTLQPYMDRASQGCELGDPGMLLCQVSWDDDGNAWLIPAFVPHDKACVLEQAGCTDIPGLLPDAPRVSSRPLHCQPKGKVVDG